MHVIQISESLLNQNQDQIDKFIHDWSLRYDYQNGEQDYDNKINQHWITLDEENNQIRLWTLFRWKFGNRINNDIVQQKINWFMEQQEEHLIQHIIVSAENTFIHQNEGHPIYSIFFMHCLDRIHWPIYDQHTHRAMRYMMYRYEDNFPTPSMDVYLNKYKNFVFNRLSCGKNQNADSLRRIDKALFAFGKFLKSKSCHEVDWN